MNINRKRVFSFNIEMKQPNNRFICSKLTRRCFCSWPGRRPAASPARLQSSRRRLEAGLSSTKEPLPISEKKVMEGRKVCHEEIYKTNRRKQRNSQNESACRNLVAALRAERCQAAHPTWVVCLWAHRKKVTDCGEGQKLDLILRTGSLRRIRGATLDASCVRGQRASRGKRHLEIENKNRVSRILTQGIPQSRLRRQATAEPNRPRSAGRARGSFSPCMHSAPHLQGGQIRPRINMSDQMERLQSEHTQFLVFVALHPHAGIVNLRREVGAC